ncbi:VOC family protein [Novosphingobium sp. AAP93]|uniref:VOC family protein n=1 Tax=Novosphingobium sp. AAP93 TaxID=1523427 RepID=UPI0006B9FFF3|nr:VOC family protein [Novosphingobium sp. AAP93]KPF84168.1 methylmalonyl-CoA epimerase [Novosphingobium sp. AAP93]
MVIRDLDKAVEDWTKILRVLDPESLEKRIVRYDEFSSGADVGMKWATFVNENSTEIQLIQPAPGTPMGRRLEKVGEHVHHLCFTTDDVPAAMAKLKAEGISLPGDGVTYNDPDMTWQKWSWVGAQSTHGCLIEVASPYESRDDGLWHHAPNKFAYKGPGEHPSHAETVPITAG